MAVKWYCLNTVFTYKYNFQVEIDKLQSCDFLWGRPYKSDNGRTNLLIEARFDNPNLRYLELQHAVAPQYCYIY